MIDLNLLNFNFRQGARRARAPGRTRSVRVRAATCGDAAVYVSMTVTVPVLAGASGQRCGTGTVLVVLS